jgi:hypothetical protein
MIYKTVNVGFRLFIDEEKQVFAARSLIGLPKFIYLFRVGVLPNTPLRKGAKPHANVCPSSRPTGFLQRCQEMILLFSRGGLPRSSGPVSVAGEAAPDGEAPTARPQVQGPLDIAPRKMLRHI